MQVEVASAINLIVGNLYNKLPRRRVDAFAEELERGILQKFQGHWYPDNPTKGAAFRCINVSGEKVDPVVVYSVVNSGLDIEEVNSYLPKDLMIWIDPGEVSYSIGEKGQVKILYSERRSSATSSDESQITSGGQTSGYSSMSNSSSASLSPVNLSDDVASSFGNMNLSTSANSNAFLSGSGWNVTPSPTLWTSTSNNTMWPTAPIQKPAGSSLWSTSTGFNNGSISHPSQALQTTAFPIGAPMRSSNNNNKTMTAAMFAQTKFGSTKLKTQTKRSNRLSPTENFPRNVPGHPILPIGSRGPPNTASQVALSDRMQQHLQQQQQSLTAAVNTDMPIDHFKVPFSSGNSVRLDKFIGSSGANTQTSNGGFAPFTLGALTGLTPSSLLADQDWVDDLTDLNVHQSSGNQLLAT